MTVDVRMELSDALEFMRGMETGSVDAILTDLPYGTTACAWDSIIPFAPMWAAVKRVLMPRGVFVTTASQPFTSKLVMSNLKWFKYELIWNRNYSGSPGLSEYRPMPGHENILVFSIGSTTYNPQMRIGKPYIDIRHNAGETMKHNNEHRLGYKIHDPVINKGTRYPLSVITIQKHNEPGQHPTQKPVSLYEYLILTYTNPGDTVLDFCAGSGTTAIACILTGRNFVGCDSSPAYVEIARRRIAAAMMQPSLLEEIP